jgi:hypothetical protein
MRKALCFLVGVLATVSMISCSRDDNSDNSTLEDNFKDRSLVKSVTATYTGGYYLYGNHKFSLSYDTSGNLQSIICEPKSGSFPDIEYENYNWSVDIVNVEYYNSWDYRWATENFIRNSEGYVTSGEITNEVYDHWIDDILSSTRPYNCAYNENNLLAQISTTYKESGVTIPVQIDYTWQNGNIILINKANHLYELEYYTDKKETRDVGLRYLPVKSTHYLSLPDNPGWTEGFSLRGGLYNHNPMFLSKNLLKKYFDGYTTIDYFYDFDSKGRVIRQTQIFTSPPTAGSGHPEKTEHIYEYFD